MFKKLLFVFLIFSGISSLIHGFGVDIDGFGFGVGDGVGVDIGGHWVGAGPYYGPNYDYDYDWPSDYHHVVYEPAPVYKRSSRAYPESYAEDYWTVTNGTPLIVTVTSDSENRSLDPRETKGLDRKESYEIKVTTPDGNEQTFEDIKDHDVEITQQDGTIELESR